MTFSILNPQPLRSLTIAALLCLSASLSAQMQVQDATSAAFSPQNLIKNVFLGAGVEVTDIQFAGEEDAIGYFSNATAAIGIDKGIVLTTGSAETRPLWLFGTITGIDRFGTNFMSHDNGSSATDSDLASLMSDPTEDMENVAVYTIKFIPTADTLRFRYAFASEEYPEYACSEYNDVFGFFIQGPGYPTFTNIAKVPGTNEAVAINSIHPSNSAYPNCPPRNSQYYINNNFSQKQPSFDGYTTVLTAVAVVTPCVEYTIKLAIGDVSDELYDSGVFLEAKSFSTRSISHEVITQSNDATLTEGCSDGTLVFHIPDPAEYTIPMDITFFGSGENGIDITSIPNQVAFTTGSDKIEIPIQAILDNENEGLEFIGVDYAKDACTRDTVYIYIRENALQAPTLPEDTTVCLTNLSSYFLDGSSPTPTPDPIMFTNTNGLSIDPANTTLFSDIQVFGIQPNLIGTGTIASVCLNINHPFVEDLDIFLISPSGAFLELTSDNGGNGDNFISTCFSETATQSIIGASAPFTGTFLPEGDFSDLYGGNTNGTWRLQITDDNTAFSGELVEWSITFSPTYSIEYAWTPSATISCPDCPITFANPTESTNYELVLTDNYGCMIRDTFSVEVIDVLEAPVLDCVNPTPNSVTFSWLDITGASGYLINVDGGGWEPVPNGATTFTVGGLGSFTAVNIEIQANNAALCSALIATGTCMSCEVPVITAEAENTTCLNPSDGSLLIQTDGLNAPYSFELGSDSNMTGIFNNLTSGIYTVTITDNSGCSISQNVFVPAPDTIERIEMFAQDVTCFGLANASIQTQVVGGTSPINFNWNNGNTTETAENLAAGQYQVTATDANGCTSVAQSTILAPSDIALNVSTTDANCFGESTGTGHVNASGGTGAFIYDWSGPNNYQSNVATPTNLAAGTYQVIVTDTNGCSKNTTTQVEQPSDLIAEMPAVSDTICYLATNGTATVYPSGGVPPYNYIWENSDNSDQSITGLQMGQFTVYVTDANGCVKTSSTFISQLDELVAEAQAQAPKCHNGVDGTATVLSAAYGQLNADLSTLRFEWNTNPTQTSATATGLAANTSYEVQVIDAQGCTSIQTVTIGNPSAIAIKNDSIGQVKCYGGSDGWAAVSVNGGQAPYAYAWTGTVGNQQAALAQNLPAGTHSVTITDGNQCTQTQTIEIAQPADIDLFFEKNGVKCFGDTDGEAKALASGGTAPFNYLWETGSTNQTVQGLTGGRYKLTTTDGKGCTKVSEVEIDTPESPVDAEIGKRNAICFEEKNGQIEFVCSGGTPPYRYSLDGQNWNGSSIQIALGAGMYYPHVQDYRGCLMAFEPVEISQRNAISVDLGEDKTINLGESVQLISIIENAVEPIEYIWSKEDSIWLSCLDCPNPFVDSLYDRNDFDLFIIDANGCFAEDRVTINVQKERRVFVPTGFTPNGDSNNDVLLTHGDPTVKVLQFRIYDRWGEMVFEAFDFPLTDKTVHWDGTFRGKNLNPAVFVWAMEVEYIDGVHEVYQGTTQLIR